jgi:hypothetical protein
MDDPDYMKSFRSDDVTPPSGSEYMKSFQPDAQDPDVVAHAAADAAPEQAAQTIDTAQKTGLSLGYIAGGLDDAVKALDKQKYASALAGRPALTAWAGQSPHHAALLKPDAEAAGKMEGWFSGWGDALAMGAHDIAYAEAMRQRTNGSNSGLAQNATWLEDQISEYDQTPHGYPQKILRALPQMVGYGVAEVAAGPAGVAGLLYLQNKGVLAREIEKAQPAQEDDRPWQWQKRDDGGWELHAPPPLAQGDRLTRDEINKYASTGSSVGAVVLAGLLTPLIRSMPGVKGAVEGLVPEVLTRGSSTLLQAGVRSLLGYGKHTFMGAMGMVLQHSINSVTVDKAAGRDADLGQIAREAARTFREVLPVAATFAAYGPARDFLTERGRLGMAPLERAQLDAQVELAKQMQLTKTAPERALELFGAMGRGAKVFIDWKAAQKMKGLDPAKVAAAEVAQDAVEVPVEEYLTKHLDQHEAVKDDVKLSADGSTMNEAKARDKELRKLLPPDMAKALLGRQTPDEVLGYEQAEVKEVPSSPTAKEGAVAESVKLYRGTGPERDPSQPGLGGARFMSPDAEVAKGYAKTGKVSAETMNFQNVLRAESREAVAEKLGMPKADIDAVITKDDALGNWADIANKAREAGYDAIAFKSIKGTEYVDLMNWLHEMVKQYGGTVEKWQDRLTPEFIAALKEEGSTGAVAPKEHAARVVEAMQLRDIDPSRFERLAKGADKYIQEAAEKARSGSVAGAKASSPADVARLQTYELARDLNRAKAAKAEEVKAELDKAFENLSKQSGDQKLRAQLGLAGKPLLHLFDALTEGTSASKTKQGWVNAHNDAVDAGAQPFSAEAAEAADTQMRGALDAAQQWMKESARPDLPSQRFLEKFLSDPKPWEQLRPAEARTIADVVKRLTTAGREESTVRRKDEKATVADAVAEIIPELQQNPSKGLPLPSGVPSSGWRDMKLNFNAMNAVQLRPKNNMRQKSPALMKWAFDPINDAVYTRDGYFREIGGAWDTAFKAMPEDVAKRRYETYDLSDKLPTDHLGLEPMKEVPRQTIWKLARHRMSKGNMERVVSTTGWDKADIDHILFDDPKTKLTVPEWDYLQTLADVNEKNIWQSKLKPHFEQHYGAAPPKVAGVPFKVQLEDGTFKEYAGGYEPLKMDARPGVAPQPEPTKGIAQYWGKDFQIPWQPGATRERVDNSHYLVNLDWDASRSSIAQTLHWLAFDQPVRSVARLFNDQGLAASMNEFMGEGRADMARGWLKSAATQAAQSVPEGMEIVGRAFGFNRKLQLMGIVGGSARLAAAQLSHPAGLMLGGEINPRHGLPALLSVFKPFTAADGEVRLFPNWNDALTYGEEVQHRADRAYNTLRQGWDLAGQSKPGPLGALKDAALRTAGLYLHAVDRLTTTWAWTAAHNEAVANGMEAFSREAVDYADGKTQDVMPVHDVETAAPILTNRQIGGFLIMHGFKNTLYNMRQDALAKSARDFNLAQTPGEYGSAAARAAGRIGLQLAMFGGFAIMGKFALGYGQQDDESKGEWLLRDFLGGQSQDIPFVGGLGEPLAKWALGGKVNKRDFSMYGNPGMAAIIKVQDTLGNLVNEGREDYKKVFDMLEATLFLSGMPSRPLRVGGEHIYEALMGEGYDDSVDPGRFFYTDKQWESIKRSLTPDD